MKRSTMWLFVTVAALAACDRRSTKAEATTLEPNADPKSSVQGSLLASAAATTAPPPPPGVADNDEGRGGGGAKDKVAQPAQPAAAFPQGLAGGTTGSSATMQEALVAGPKGGNAQPRMAPRQASSPPAYAPMTGGAPKRPAKLAMEEDPQLDGKRAGTAVPPQTVTPQQNGYARPADVPAEPAPPPVAVLDRNARYATTYRPGGAAIAAFDAAVTKGSIPTTYKDLVGDFGGRYAPTLNVPSGSAMAFSIETERGKLAPSGGLVNLRIAMRSSTEMPGRAPLSVHLVLDVSGSMQGLAIENAKQAAETLVSRLEPQDDFSMVIFSDDAQVLVEDGPAVSRRDRILGSIRKIQAEGGTNISSGLDAGYKLAHTASINPDAVKIVMFLSDGHANAGDTNPSSIAQRSAKAFQDGIQTSSFGLGADFDAQIMSSVADQGAGGYYYLADSSQIAPALNREMDARLVPVAQAVEVRLRLRPEITPRKVFGSHALDKAEAALVRQQELVVDSLVQKRDNIKKDRQTDAEGGMRFFMPSFSRDDRHAMLVTVEVPEGMGEATIGSVEIKYKDRLAKKNVTQEIPIRTTYAASDAESASTTNASVAATVQAFAAGDAILKAADAIDRGNRAYAAQLLRERAELLKRASAALEEPRLGEEGLRLARLALATSGDQKVSDPLPLAVMLRGSGYGYLR
jgi:Ca-activated chloride channel family protein